MDETFAWLSQDGEGIQPSVQVKMQCDTSTASMEAIFVADEGPGVYLHIQDGGLIASLVSFDNIQLCFKFDPVEKLWKPHIDPSQSA